MKTFTLIATAAAVFAVALAAPADAAAKKKPKHRVVQHAAMTDHSGLQGGVMKGPLYNGQDYLGDDPDPSIRAYMIKDLGMRYGQSH